MFENKETDINIRTPYKKPEITTYSEQEIIALIGPVNTVGSHFGGHGLHLGWERGRRNPNHP